MGGFFVPILNLFLPYQVTKEIWKASDPNVTPESGLDWQDAPTSPLIISWWIAFLVSWFVGYSLFRMSISAETISDLISMSESALFGDIIHIAAATLQIILVRTIDKRQTIKSLQMFHTGNPQNELRRGLLI